MFERDDLNEVDPGSGVGAEGTSHADIGASHTDTGAGVFDGNADADVDARAGVYDGNADADADVDAGAGITDADADAEADVEAGDAGWSSIFGPYLELAHTALLGLRGLPVEAFGHQEQLALAAGVGPLRSELESLIGDVLVAIQSSGASVAEHGLNAPKWFAGQTGDSQSGSQRSFVLGRARKLFPLFAAAVDDNQISVDHLHVLAMAMNPRVLTVMQAIEQQLVEVAVAHSVEQWRKELRAMINYADQDGPEPQRPPKEDDATVVFDETGRLLIRGEFHGASAVTIYDLINKEVSRQLRAARQEAREFHIDVPPHKSLRGRALAEILLRGGNNSNKKRGKTEAFLVLDPRSERHPIRTFDGHDVDPVTAAQLLCGASITPLHVDGHGNPLNLGRTDRYASSAQHRALAIRDGGCVFPGCDQPASWCDAHHVVTWTEQQGPTDINNLVLLCPFHHRQVHSNNWDLIPAVDINYRNAPPHVLTDLQPNHRDSDGHKHDDGSFGTVSSSSSGCDTQSYSHKPPILIHQSTQKHRHTQNAETRHKRQKTGQRTNVTHSGSDRSGKGSSRSRTSNGSTSCRNNSDDDPDPLTT